MDLRIADLIMLATKDASARSCHMIIKDIAT